MGAYLSTFAPFIPTCAGTERAGQRLWLPGGPRAVIGVFTNTVPVDAYRGAGRPESNYLVERLIDAAARELGIDRVEFRRRNMVPPSRHAAHDAASASATTAAISRACWMRRWRKTGLGRLPGPARGGGARGASGAASAWPTTWKPPAASRRERAEIRFAADGFVDVYVGTQSTGQGHETAYAS